MPTKSLQEATLGAGCFWCIEAVFQELRGVESVVSGYSGGTVPGKPTYREVCSGLTGHAEVVRVRFNPEEISFRDLLVVFLSTHDPTTLNRQGADRGTQYRSVVFFHDAEQEQVAREVIAEMQQYFDDPIVTEVSPLSNFYEADPEHQDFYRRNPELGYCRVVIDPKMRKLRDLFASRLKNPA
ncbi:peptide-methionine (S)-S-oxide reductase MsrA [Robiginitalea biformata]|uniref:Peptide methionine sulfoxide reductase MsrA n=1 Tax=Robiginitalea biformata (strain ATCC BAA-864 / DSM 15991 / KCTC 12146 / HTCC2501) TaxID=313596 RepID=A4CJA1_ROBBH|nr:peptide-methionine (S)-S-oxide reductase MsrA [Robiginitalea biformata]EAR17009.1 Peptide methionine sulfoxide reductase [Robiginitalea biformata HTCC2501]